MKKMPIKPHAVTLAKKKFGASFPFFYGWIVVAIAFVTMALGVNARTSFSLLFPPILDEFEWSRGTVAATFSIGFIISTILTPFIGAMMDNFGPRLVLPLGGILTGVGLILSTFSSEPWHFFMELPMDHTIPTCRPTTCDFEISRVTPFLRPSVLLEDRPLQSLGFSIWLFLEQYVISVASWFSNLMSTISR